MNKNKIKAYAPVARKELIAAVTAKAQVLGLSGKKIESVEVKGDLAIIAGRPFPRSVAPLRRNLEAAIKREGFDQLIERIAFTWFNRFTALRYMELHGFLDHGYRVLSHPKGGNIPEILEHATDLDLTGLDKAKVTELRFAGNKDSDLYRLLLVAQCNSLNAALPFLFERTNDETELLLPDNLLHSDSPIRKLVDAIEESDWKEVEIVGWLYQFYISEKKDAVIGKVVKSEDIPAATQLFTPNWIVKYLVQNTLGRQWMATYPNSAIKGNMEFYIEPAEQTDEVKAQLKAITPSELNPEEITFFDPACGSGHILVEAYDLFKQIYEERGYARRDIPRLILENNLFGLDIDERAAQFSAFALMMKARADDRSLFRADAPVRLNVMAIQESNGLDSEEIARTLLKEKVQKLLDSDVLVQQELAGIASHKIAQPALFVTHKPDIDKGLIETLLKLFENAKTFGSLLQMPEVLIKALPKLEILVDPTIGRDLAGHTAAEALRPFVRQARFLSNGYDNVVANPPYMGSNGMNPSLKEFAKKYFPDSKSDLFAMFIVRGFKFVKSKTGCNGMVTMQNWMFLSSYEALRKDILANRQIETLIQIGYNSFPEINSKIAQACAFTIRSSQRKFENGMFINLNSAPQSADKREIFLRRNKALEYAHNMDDFKKIPGSPIAYWVSQTTQLTFELAKPLSDFCNVCSGLSTTNNDRFLRLWYEISNNNISFKSPNSIEARKSGKRWFPFQKGGNFRKWYGNNEYLVNWLNDGQEIKDTVVNNPKDPDTTHWSRRIFNTDVYFSEGITWSTITSSKFSARYAIPGSIISNAAGGIFLDESELFHPTLALLCSKLADHFLNIINPTLNFSSGTVAKFPTRIIQKASINVTEILSLSKADWDMFELSWDFLSQPLVIGQCKTTASNSSQIVSHISLAITYEIWLESCRKSVLLMKHLEKANNQLFIDAYELGAEITPEVPEEQITLTVNPKYRYGKGLAEEDYQNRFRLDSTKELLSYAVGCIMGRYSLDKSNLIYAAAGNEGFDYSRYKTFPADDDGIVPVSDIEWFNDDATPRLVEFIKTVFGFENLDENLTWIAASFDPKKGETPTETIRRYFSTQFFKNHMQMYKKRPIYWLFSSGKQKAFECLVYLHRYNESTLSRMRAQYVTPLQGKLNARIEHIRREAEGASSASAKTKLSKEVEMLVKKQTELAKFDEELRHYADQRIKLDLDDGVRVNYGKFGNLLAEVKHISSGDEE